MTAVITSSPSAAKRVPRPSTSRIGRTISARPERWALTFGIERGHHRDVEHRRFRGVISLRDRDLDPCDGRRGKERCPLARTRRRMPEIRPRIPATPASPASPPERTPAPCREKSRLRRVAWGPGIACRAPRSAKHAVVAIDGETSRIGRAPRRCQASRHGWRLPLISPSRWRTIPASLRNYPSWEGLASPPAFRAPVIACYASSAVTMM